jgi:hypothetical protein
MDEDKKKIPEAAACERKEYPQAETVRRGYA